MQPELPNGDYSQEGWALREQAALSQMARAAQTGGLGAYMGLFMR